MTTTAADNFPDISSAYRVLRSLGEGGMAEVYLAEQLEPVRRQVAVKVLKAGMDSKQVLARFNSERQALAVLEHPNIAKVFDGGIAASGRPYFVMEYVDGVPITEFCDRESLATGARLELFVDVCRAVQHAHLKGLIHRDLKPANILVTRVDGRPKPKVIDFGVAKAVEAPLTEETLETRLGQVVGTPHYMSPEQIGAGPIDIDSRADVYSLGVVLYEVLVGALPLDLHDVRPVALPSVVREKMPLTPSARFASLREGRADIAHDRRTSPQDLGRVLKGDLDWVVMKAIEKDRDRRYETPTALAADCERYLHHQPVQARPPSTAYQLSRFARRNRTIVIAASVAIVALLAGSVAATLGFLRATSAEQTALREAETAKQVSDFMVGLFRNTDPAATLGNDPTAREMLDRGVRTIGDSLDEQPLVKATLQTTMGTVYRSLQQLPTAEELFRDAYDTRNRLLGPDHPDTLTAANWLTIAISEQSRLDEVLDLKQDILERRQRVLGDEHVDTLRSMHNLGVHHRFTGDLGQAERYLSDALAREVDTLGNDHDLTLLTLQNLGQLFSQMGRHDEAEPILADVSDRRGRLLGPDHPQTLNALSALADLHLTIGRLDSAAALYGDILERRRRVLGATHAQTLWTQDGLATTYAEQGLIGDAEVLMKETIAGLSDAYGEEHLTTLAAMTNLGELYRMAGRTDDAEPIYLTLLERQERLYPDTSNTGIANHNLAALYTMTDRHADAIALFAEAERIWSDLVPIDHIYRRENTRLWAEALRGSGDIAGAEVLEARLAEIGASTEHVNPRH